MKTRQEMAEPMQEQRPDWDTLKNLQALVPTRVVHRELAAETVLLNVETGRYFGMDEIGARFFKVVSSSPNLETAATTLEAEYEGTPNQIREDLVRFCNELDSLGLIDLVEQTSSKRH